MTLNEQTGHTLDAREGQGTPAGRQQGAIEATTPTRRPPPAGNGTPAANLKTPAMANARSPQVGEGEAVHPQGDFHGPADRFADPLIAEIVETWRQRQDMVRAMTRLTLQAKAMCRRITGGDKKDADKLYAAIAKGGEHPLAFHGAVAVLALREAMKPLETTRKAYERHLTRLGSQLPIAHMAESIRGVSTLTLAVVVAECGDLSVYEKGVAGVWKRAGLAVINGERQRKKSNLEEAEAHGYSPSRRSVFWNIASALLKAQGKDEKAGPYRLVYDERKAYERPRVESDGHAHNRAMRHMAKRLLKDLWMEWSNQPKKQKERMI